MKKITIILLLIVSLILPQTVEAADDEPFNPWTSCSRNFVKYSNKGEYCYILEVTGSINDIQYILAHDVANRNPLIKDEGSMRHFLKLFDTTRYEVYYSDKVQSLTGLKNIFEGDEIELTTRRPNGLKIEVIRSNFGLYNLEGQLIYDANYYSDVTEVVKEPDWLTDDRLTGNPYYLAVFQNLNPNASTYNHYIGIQLDPWISYFNSGRKVYVPKLSDDFGDPYKIRNCFIWYGSLKVNFSYCDLGTTLEDSDFTNNPVFNSYMNLPNGGVGSGDTRYNFIYLENAQYNNEDRSPWSKLILYNWTYGENIVYTGLEGTTPTPIVKPTAAPLVSPGPIAGEDNGVFNLGQTIKRIFLPSPDILYNEVNASKDLLLNKLHIDLDSFKPQNAGRPQNVTMKIYGHSVTLLDFGQVEDLVHQATTPINIARVFIYIFSLWGLIKFIIDYFNNRGGGAVNA